MKLRDLVAVVLVVFTTLSARSQEGFYYQAVIRNTDGSPIKNTSITLTLSLVDSETVVYSEQHTLESSPNGLINATLGSGTTLSGTLSNVDWSHPIHLHEQIVLNDGNLVSSSQLILKTPRAYVADKALELAPASVKSAHIVNQSVSNDHIATDAKIDFQKLDISREDIESLGISSGRIYSAGTNIRISDTGEISSVDTNTIYTAGTNISISDDGEISAVDTDTDTNTTYTLSFSGTTLSLTDSDGVATDIDLASIDTDTNTTYSAGANISISDSGEISSIDTDTTYSAGANISISEEGEISAVDTNTVYTAGTNISIDANNVISAVDTDTDTNTTYTLDFSGTILTLTDSDGTTTDIDLASIDTDTNTTYSAGANITISDSGEISAVDTNTTYTAGTNISIDANNVISAVDTDTDTNTTYTLGFSGTTLTLTDSDGTATDIDLASIDTDTNTTYTAGNGLLLTDGEFTIDSSVVTNSYNGSVTANSFIGNFVGDGSGLTNITLDHDSVYSFMISDGSITSSKLEDDVITSSKIADGSIVASDISETAAIPFSKLSISKSDIVDLGIPESDTTYTTGTGLVMNDNSIEIDNTVVTSNYLGSVVATAFVGNGSGLTDLTIPDASITSAKLSDQAVTSGKVADDSITSSKIANGSITSDKLDSSLDILEGISINTISDYTNGRETVFNNSGEAGNFSLILSGSSSVTDTNYTNISLPTGYSINSGSMIFITKTSLENSSADIISELDVPNNIIKVRATSNGAPYPLTITFNFMIINFDY